MKEASLLVSLIVSLATVASAAVYKEGKTVMDKDCRFEIVKMKWGLKDKETDRLLGTARLYVDESQAYEQVVLTFDVYDMKAEKIDTLDVEFTLREYGYKRGRSYLQGEFCVDFGHPEDANRLTLKNAKFSGDAVTYRTKFNISGSLNRTRFQLRKPKVTPVKR